MQRSRYELDADREHRRALVLGVPASGTTYPSFNIEVDPVGDGSGYTTFVFVPDAGTISASPAWQTWNGLSTSDGTWYSTATLATPPFNCAFQAAGCDASWSEIQTAYPLRGSSTASARTSGSGGTFTGNIDNFTRRRLG